MIELLERRFDLTANGTSIRTEVAAGCTTFLTMAYILFVQPTVLGAAGMDAGAVLVATCLASALATALMAILANYPIAVAPAMGHNFFFAYSVVLGLKVPWQVALGAVALAGALFIVTAGVGLREHLITAIPASLKHAIAAGIGLLIASVGLQWAGLVVSSPGTLVTLGDLHQTPVLAALAGLGVSAVLMARRVRGAFLYGMLFTAAVGVWQGFVRYDGIASLPPAIAPTLGQLDIVGALAPDMIAVIFVLDQSGCLCTVSGLAVPVPGRANDRWGSARGRCDLVPDHCGTADPRGDDDGRRAETRGVAGADRCDSRVSDAHHDATGVQHHRGRGVWSRIVCGIEGRVRARPGHPSPSSRVCPVVPCPIRVATVAV